MDPFDGIDGVHPDKFYALGAHVYTSAATCLDRALALSGKSMREEDRLVFERLSTRLKRLGNTLPSPKDPWPNYWQAGGEIAEQLTEHMAHVKKWKR